MTGVAPRSLKILRLVGWVALMGVGTWAVLPLLGDHPLWYLVMGLVAVAGGIYLAQHSPTPPHPRPRVRAALRCLAVARVTFSLTVLACLVLRRVGTVSEEQVEGVFMVAVLAVGAVSLTELLVRAVPPSPADPDPAEKAAGHQ